jgi:hypothetical protein
MDSTTDDSKKSFLNIFFSLFLNSNLKINKNFIIYSFNIIIRTFSYIA